MLLLSHLHAGQGCWLRSSFPHFKIVLTFLAGFLDIISESWVVSSLFYVTVTGWKRMKTTVKDENIICWCRFRINVCNCLWFEFNFERVFKVVCFVYSPLSEISWVQTVWAWQGRGCFDCTLKFDLKWLYIVNGPFFFWKISFSDVGWSPESRQRMLGKVAAVMTGGLEDLPGLQLLLLQLHLPHVANLPGPWLGGNGKALEENRILYLKITV